MSEIAALIGETNELVEAVRGLQPLQIPIQLQAIEAEQQALAVQAEAVQADLSKLLAQLASNVSEIETRLANLITGPIATIQSAQGAQSDSQAEVDSAITALETQVTAITITLDDLSTTLANLEQGTAGADAATAQALVLLQTQADSLSTQVADITGELTGDDLVINEWVTQTAGFSTSIDALTSGLTAAQTDITTVNGLILLLQQQAHPVVSHGILLTQREITGTKNEMPLYEAVQPPHTWVPGDEFRFVLAGRIEGNRGTKEIKVRVNGVELFKARMSSNTRHPWQAQGSVAIRPGNEAVVVFHLDYHAARVLHTTVVIAFDPAVENTLAITGKLSKESDHIFGEMARGETVHHVML